MAAILSRISMTCDAMSAEATEYRASRQLYRCVVTASDGRTATTEPISFALVAEARSLGVAETSNDAEGSVAETPEGQEAEIEVAPEGEANAAVADVEAEVDERADVPVVDEAAAGDEAIASQDADGGPVAEAALAILAQPGDCREPEDGVAAFRVEAAGEGLSYRWGWTADGGKTWERLPLEGEDGFEGAVEALRELGLVFDGADAAELRVRVDGLPEGLSFRCVVTDVEGAAVTTDAVAFVPAIE